jgi:tetratricopeptide (TPR) repeat protein
MLTRKPTTRPASFYDHLKQALELIDSPAQLGERSPLAAPYFLGYALRGAEASAAGRGQALIAVLLRAAEQLWGGPLPESGQEMLAAALAEADPGGRYDCLVLELNYFKQRYRPAPKSQAEIYLEILHISRPTHDRHLRRAIERLGSALLQQIRPALHLDQPEPPPLLVGREAILHQIQAELRLNKTVSLSGPGGVGKTALAAALAEQYEPGQCFWYTFRSTLNDQLESLLFALGHFLHQQGASNLWHQMVAERGRVPEGSLALGMALADLAELPQRPLLCFDELDLLHPQSHEQHRQAHVQIGAFLEGLRGHVPILLLGQRAVMASDSIHQLAALPNEYLADWLAQLVIPYSEGDLEQLQRSTAGNPRLVELCVALYRAGASANFSAVLEQLPNAQALLPLWLRLERQLTSAERDLLHALAVFRSPAPADDWRKGPPELADALQQLVARRLVQQDERGGVALLPALRAVVYDELSVERREEFHSQAAQIRAERGEYTAAAYHLQRAGQAEAAIDLWYPQRDHEINQGQASAALTIFTQISHRRVSARHQRDLLLLRAELYELAGEPSRVAAELAQAEWSPAEPTTPAALLRLGKAMEAQGQPEHALKTYQSGLDALSHLLSQGTQLHTQRSLTSLRRREMQQARHEANLAHFHAEIMLGVVSEQSGEYTPAEQHYGNALRIATSTDYPAGTAQAHQYLATLAGRRQDLGAALPHFEQAMAFYQHIGDRVQCEIVRSNLASVYIQARQFAAALEPAERALQFFAAMGNGVRIAQNASNLAEAHAELGNLGQAEHYAQLVLQQEQPQSHPYALYTLGTVYRQRDDWHNAQRYYDQSRRIAEINGDSYLLAFAWRALGEVARMQGEQQQAREAFAQALELFAHLDIPEEVRETERIIAQDDA